MVSAKVPWLPFPMPRLPARTPGQPRRSFDCPLVSSGGPLTLWILQHVGTRSRAAIFLPPAPFGHWAILGERGFIVRPQRIGTLAISDLGNLQSRDSTDRQPRLRAGASESAPGTPLFHTPPWRSEPPQNPDRAGWTRSLRIQNIRRFRRRQSSSLSDCSCCLAGSLDLTKAVSSPDSFTDPLAVVLITNQHSKQCVCGTGGFQG
jgi:hypothetical protein